MPRISCLAGIASQEVAFLSAVLKSAGFPVLALAARSNVTELGGIKPAVVVCDIDALDVDPFEFLRQVRFVLQDCIIIVYTATMKRSWSVACHLAGANGLLLKDSTKAELILGIHRPVRPRPAATGVRSSRLAMMSSR